MRPVYGLAMMVAAAIALALFVGCPQALCDTTGGHWTICGSGCGPLRCGESRGPDVSCPAVCVPQCECPEDAPYWDAERGCLTEEQCEVLEG